MKKNNLIFAIIGMLFILSFARFAISSSLSHDDFNNGSWINKHMALLQSHAKNINPKVLKLSLKAYVNARKQDDLGNKQLLTVIDYSKPSNQKRLWVFDLKSGKALFNTWVSHGKNSGGLLATSFSNRPGSLKSSLGVFVTEQTYVGKNGYSLRLKGLEQGVNDNAYRRSVVIHGAWYVNADRIEKAKQAAGRSWGCPSVSKKISRPLINAIKNNTLVFAYYPDQNWLTHSQFLA